MLMIRGDLNIIPIYVAQPCPTATPLGLPPSHQICQLYIEHILKKILKSSAFVFLLYLSHTFYTKNHRLLLLNTNHVIQCSMFLICRQSAIAMETRVLMACWHVRGPRQSAASQGACHLYSLGMPGTPPTLHRVGRMWGMTN